MNLVNYLENMGIKITATSNGQISLSGLDKLYTEQVNKLRIFVYKYKPQILKQLQKESIVKTKANINYNIFTPLTSSQCQEIKSWPIYKQQIFIGYLNKFEAQGENLIQAEAKAYYEINKKITNYTS